MAFPRRRTGYRPGGFGSYGGAGFDFTLSFWVKWIMISNTAIFLLMAVGLLPAGWMVRNFGFSVPTLLTRPWSPITYMFLHGGFWHLFMNMIVLFFFGRPLEGAWGSRYFIKFYLVAGLGGALLALPLYPLIGGPFVIGASGAIFGLLLAFALNWPEAPVYIWGILPIKAKWFVGIIGGITVLATFTGGGGGVAHWAHLGGLITGFAFLKWGDRIRVPRFLSRTRGRLRSVRFKEESGSVPRGRRPASPVRPRPGSSPTVERDPRPSRRRRGIDGDTLDEVDRLLDKIRERGMDSLTPKERAFLDEVSRRYQKT